MDKEALFQHSDMQGFIFSTLKRRPEKKKVLIKKALVRDLTKRDEFFKVLVG